MALTDATDRVRLLEAFLSLDGVIIELPFGEDDVNYATEGTLTVLRSVRADVDRAAGVLNGLVANVDGQ